MTNRIGLALAMLAIAILVFSITIAGVIYATHGSLPMMLMVAFTTTIGLPYAVAGSLQSGRLQHLRSEENAIKALVCLLVTVLAVAPVSIFVPSDMGTTTGIGGTAVIGIVAGMSYWIAWKMFAKGGRRGQDLAKYRLEGIFVDLRKSLKALNDTSTQVVNDRKNDSKQIRDEIEDLRKRMSIDEEIRDFAGRIAEEKASDIANKTMSKICGHGKKLLEDIGSENKGLMAKVDRLLKEAMAKMTPNQDGADPAPVSVVPSHAGQLRPVPNCGQVQSVRKILDMLTVDLAQYRPRGHRLCIAIYTLQQNRKSSTSSGERYMPNLSEISGMTGVNKADVRSRLQDLVNSGLVQTQKGQQSRIEFTLSERLDRVFSPVLKNQREGGMEAFDLIRNAKDYYLSEGSYFEVLRQDITKEQPDAVAIPPLDNDGYNLAGSRAVEIETPQEVRSHPDQIKNNMAKNLGFFSGVDVWCYEENRDSIENILKSLSLGQQRYIQVIVVHDPPSSGGKK